MAKRTTLLIILTVVGLVTGLSAWVPREPSNTASAGPPVVGQPGVSFALRGDDGRVYRPADGGEGPAVVGFFCGCRRCRRTAGLMEERLRVIHGARLFGITAMNRADATACKQEMGVAFPFLFDAGGRVAASYGSSLCPVLWLFDARGRIRFTSRGRTDAPEAWMQEIDRSLGRSVARR